MILIDSLLYEIDQKLNKLSSNYHQEIPLEDKILALNEAQVSLIKNKITGFSPLPGMGLDSFKKRYEDLQNLITLYQKLNISKGDPSLNEWNSSLPVPNYMFYIDSYIIADKGRCKDRIIWVNRELAKHADIRFLINNVHYSPSFEYQETFNTITDNKISIYTDGTFTPKELHLSFLKYPKYMNKEGYIDLAGIPSNTVDCELHSYLKEELLNVAVKNLAMYTENAPAVQGAQMRINVND